MAHHELIIHPLVLRCVRVQAVVDLTPRMRRITFTGPQLGSFTRDGLTLPPFAAPGFDDHVKLIFAADGDVDSVLPAQLAGGIEWAPSDTRQGRDYTPRRFDPSSLQLDLDFVMHGDGPAASWARNAEIGDDLWFAGPKSSTVLPEQIDWVLLAGDETALPAIARFLEERPTAAPVRAVIALTDRAAQQSLTLRPEDRVEWLIAEEADDTALADRVAAIPALNGVPYVWAAAEARALLPVRRLARTLGAPKSHVNITGYWHHQSEREQESGSGQPAALPDAPLDWFALRAALRIGLLDALAGGATHADTLAADLSIPRAHLQPLIELLAQRGILTADEHGAIGLDRLGEALCEDEHAKEHYVGFEADQALSLAALPESFGSGSSAWTITHGSSLRATVERDAEHYREFVAEASGLPHVLTGLAEQPVWGRGAPLVITGPGALEVGAVLHRETGARVTIHEKPLPLAVLRDEADGLARGFLFEDALPAQQHLAVTALALAHRNDDEAVDLLRSLSASAPAAVLIERLSPDGLSPAAGAAQGLLDLASLGVPTRTPEAVVRLAESAGWSVQRRRKLGWGIESVELTAAPPAQ